MFEYITDKLSVQTTKSRIYFNNPDYNMHMYVYMDEISDVIADPYAQRWGKSNSNSVKSEDMELILSYLRKYALPRYKTVEAVLKSRSKRKRWYLNHFSLSDLVAYNSTREKKKEETTC